MAKRLKRVTESEEIENYGRGDPVLDLLREFLKNDTDRWKVIVDNDKKCRREQRQKEINYKKRYRL